MTTILVLSILLGLGIISWFVLLILTIQLRHDEFALFLVIGLIMGAGAIAAGIEFLIRTAQVLDGVTK